MKLPTALDAWQMAAMNLTFVTIEQSPATGAAHYVYGPSGAGAKGKTETKKRKGVPAVASMPHDEDEEEEEDDDDE